MINWIKKEYKRFCESRTVKLAYAQKLLGVIVAISSMVPFLKEYMTPETIGITLVLLGYIAKQLRLVTTSKLE